MEARAPLHCRPGMPTACAAQHPQSLSARHCRSSAEHLCFQPQHSWLDHSSAQPQKADLRADIFCLWFFCQANNISIFKGVFPCLVTWQETACSMAQTILLGKKTSESFPANSLLFPGLLQLRKCLLLLPADPQLQNSWPAVPKTPGRLLGPAEPSSLP